MKERSFGWIGPFPRARRQRRRIARRIPYTEKSCLLAPPRRSAARPRTRADRASPCAPPRPARHWRWWRALPARRQAPRGSVPRNFDRKQRRQQRLMPHRGQKFRDLRAIFGRAGDKEFAWRSIIIYSPFVAAGLEEGPQRDAGSLNTLTILGLETSCDETAAAVVRGLPAGARRNLVQYRFQPDRSPCALWRRGAGNRQPRASGNPGRADRTRAFGCGHFAWTMSMPSPPRRGLA